MSPAAAAEVLVDEKGRRIRVYQDSVRNEFGFLKSTRKLDDMMARSIPLADDAGFLVPVCELHADDDVTITMMSNWRRRHFDAYPTQFPVTEAGTKSWLRAKVLEVPDRMLFLVLDKMGRPVGHMGFASCDNDAGEMEADNIVRGEDSAPKGIMSAAMEAMFDWAHKIIGYERIFLRVFSDNTHAVTFYRRLGFRDDTQIALRKTVKGDVTAFSPIEAGDNAPADRFFLRMVLEQKPLENPTRLILTAGPSISAREASYSLDAARYGWNNRWSEYLRRFQEATQAYLGVPHALATSSGTGALHLALAALKIGPGDEVIVPDLTWVASANAVLYVGATPVFADVEPGSWCMCPKSFESLITPKTKAVMPVHLYGFPANMEPIMEIARKHDLYVVEDAAPALGAECRGRKVGTYGHFSCFSFQGAKLLVTGEGGMLVCNDPALYPAAECIWDQGRDAHRAFWINETGLKYKMSNIQAAIGLGQLERVDQMVEAKRRIFSWYEEGLADVPGISLHRDEPWARSIQWMSSIILEENAAVDRETLRTELKKRNVDSRPVFPAISQYPMWTPRPKVQPTAQRIGDRGVNLPSGVCLTRPEVDYVCRAVREILAR